MKKFWPLIVLVFLTILFFYPSFFNGEIFYFGDNLSLFLPVLKFFTDQLKRAQLPLWNPYLFTGLPFLTDFGLSILNPLNFFFFLLPAFEALTWVTITEIFLASLFTFLFLKSLGQDRVASVLGAVVFAFSASLLTFLNNISLLSSAYLLPLVFWAGRRALVRGNFSRLAFLGFIMTIQLISGHPQPTFYTFFLLGLYFLFYPKIFLKQKIKRGLVSLVTFFCFSAFAFLPFLELVSFSTRPTDSFGYVTAWSLHPVLLLRFFLPGFFGSAVKGFSWGPAYRMVADNTGHFGLLTILIIFLGLVKKKRKSFAAKFFLIIFFLTLFLAMGKYTPVFFLFYRFFPGLRFFRSPTQILLLTNFAAAVLAGLAWPSFLASLRKKRSKQMIKKLMFLIVLFNLILVIIFLGKKNFFIVAHQWLEKIYFWAKKTPLSTSSFHNFQVDQVIFENIMSQLFLTSFILGLFLIMVFFYQQAKIRLWLFSLLSLFLIFLNLFLFNRNNYFSTKSAILANNHEIGQSLKVLAGHYRFISSAGYWPYTGLNVYWENVALRPPFAISVFTPEEQKNFKTLKSRLKSLPPDWGVKFELATPMGYGDLLLKDFADFMSQRMGRVNINEVDSLPLGDEKLNFLGVKYLLVDASFPSTVKEVQGFDHYVLVEEIENVKIYENQKVWPRVFLEKDGKRLEEAEIVSYGPNKVKIKVEAKDGGQLVLTDVYYPGWEVLVDGKREKVEKYQELFRMVKVLPGQHEVEFIFRPKSFYWGAGVSLVGFLTVGGVILRKKFGRKSRL